MGGFCSRSSSSMSGQQQQQQQQVVVEGGGRKKWSRWTKPVSTATPEEKAAARKAKWERRERAKGLRNVMTKTTGVATSAWQLNLLAKLVRGLTVQQAIGNLTYHKKKHAATTLALVSRACTLAERRHGLIPEELQITTVFVTRGPQTKRLRIMGRGRTGFGYRRTSHMYMTVTEIDWEAMEEQAKTPSARKAWEKRRGEVEALKAQMQEEAAAEAAEEAKRLAADKGKDDKTDENKAKAA